MSAIVHEEVLELLRHSLRCSHVSNFADKMSRLLIILADKPQYMKTLRDANNTSIIVLKCAIEKILEDDETARRAQSKRILF